jgi:hypothetical protein
MFDASPAHDSLVMSGNCAQPVKLKHFGYPIDPLELPGVPCNLVKTRGIFYRSPF